MNADLFGRSTEQPPVRHDAVDTSRAAGARIAPVWTGIKRLCLDAIRAEGQAGLTCDELAHHAGLPILSVRPAVCMLAKNGAVVDSGGRRRNERGNTAIVWVVPPAVGASEAIRQTTPREPAQERQDARPVTRAESAALHDALVASSTPVPPGGADPLLPGLLAVEDKFRELTLRSDTNLTTDYADLVNWVSDKIARREGAT